MKNAFFSFQVTTNANVTNDKIAVILRQLLDAGLADAQETIESGEGNIEAAQLATDLNISAPQFQPSHAEILKMLKTQGLTIADCITAFGASPDDLHVKAARENILGDDDVEIDDITTISEADDGAWVLAWLWVSNIEAGIASDSPTEPTPV